MERRESLIVLKVVLSLLMFQLQTAASDHFKLVLQWPPAYCATHPHECNAAVAGSKNKFTIHGFWPSDDHGNLYQYCNNTWVISQTDIADQVPSLRQEWPSLRNGWTDLTLWQHEWIKHGTCSNLQPSDYFQVALNLKTNPTYDIYRFLDNRGLAPTTNASNSVTPLKIETVLNAQLGETPSTHCERNPINNVWLITEIVLCFNPHNYCLVECPEDRMKWCIRTNSYVWATRGSSSTGPALLSFFVEPVLKIHRHFAATTWCFLALVAGSFVYFFRRKGLKILHHLRAARAPKKQD